MKIAVVSSITGGKDKILKVNNFNSADYYMFTETKFITDCFHNNWLYRPIPKFSQLTKPDRRNAKIPKVLPFMLLPQYDFIIWHDGGHLIQVDPEVLVNKYLQAQNKDMAAFLHGRAFSGLDHNCIYDEAKNIKNVGFLEDPAILDEQVAAYKTDGFPAHYGLSCNAAMIWRNHADIISFQLAWWEQICKYSSRDQMSFFYTLWKTDMKDRFTYIDGHWEGNKDIPRIRGHINTQK